MVEQVQEQPQAQKYYVSMTDKFFSGWGMAEGRIAKFVVECDTLEQAQVVKANAQDRPDMKNIRICFDKKPSYRTKTHQTNYKTIADVPSWFKPNHFRGLD